MDDKKAVVRRLKSIEGHVRGITNMIEQDAYCVDAIQQIRAVQSALDKVAEKILQDHLSSCVVGAVRGDDADERERVLGEILTVFQTSPR